MASELMPPTPWLTVTQAATYAQRHPKTLLLALRRGGLKGAQARANANWRIHRDDVDAWIRDGSSTQANAA